MTAPDLRALLKASLRYVDRCACLRPATYARAMCSMCDECAADPTLSWFVDKDAHLLPQAAFARAALAALTDHAATTKED